MKLNNEVKSILKAILATVLYIIGIELLGSWYLITGLFEFDNSNKYYYLIQGALQLIVILIFTFFIKNQTFNNRIKKTHYKWYLYALILGISFAFIQTPLNWIYNFLFGTEHTILYKFDGLSTLKNVNLISVILFLPICEELFFRGYIQNNLQKKTNKFIAILLASLLFALIHSPYTDLILGSSKQDWHLFYITIFGGIISGLLYYKTKSIGSSILFHISWNLTVTIL